MENTHQKQKWINETCANSLKKIKKVEDLKKMILKRCEQEEKKIADECIQKCLNIWNDVKSKPDMKNIILSGGVDCDYHDLEDLEGEEFYKELYSELYNKFDELTF